MSRNALASSSLLTRSKSHQPQYSAMRLALDNDEFSEVLVESNKNTTLSARNGEHGLISRVVVPIAAPDDVVT